MANIADNVVLQYNSESMMNSYIRKKSEKHEDNQVHYPASISADIWTHNLRNTQQ